MQRLREAINCTVSISATIVQIVAHKRCMKQLLSYISMFGVHENIPDHSCRQYAEQYSQPGLAGPSEIRYEKKI